MDTIKQRADVFCSFPNFPHFYAPFLNTLDAESGENITARLPEAMQGTYLTIIMAPPSGIMQIQFPLGGTKEKGRG